MEGISEQLIALKEKQNELENFVHLLALDIRPNKAPPCSRNDEIKTLDIRIEDIENKYQTTLNNISSMQNSIELLNNRISHTQAVVENLRLLSVSHGDQLQQLWRNTRTIASLIY